MLQDHNGWWCPDSGRPVRTAPLTDPIPAVVGVLRFSIRLPAAMTLKDKRQVVGSLLARIRARFQVAVAEVGGLHLVQRAEIAVVCVSNQPAHASSILNRVHDFVEAGLTDALVENVSTELVRL